MAYRTFHPGDYGFQGRNTRTVGGQFTGPQSMSGVVQVLKTDGGPRVAMDFDSGAILKREKFLKWRAETTAMDEGATPVIVMLCDRRHQPVNEGKGPPWLAWGDGVVLDYAPLRAVTLTIDTNTPQKLIGGEWFSINHPSWGWRAYLVTSVSDDGHEIEFRPPLREVVNAGTVIELKNPRCLMQLVEYPGNPLSGRLGSPSIRFIEYMGKPTTPLITEFQVSGGIGEAYAQWRNPSEGNFGYARLFESSSNVFSSATAASGNIGGYLAQPQSFTDNVASGTHYYWVVAYTPGGVASSPIGPVMVSVS